MAVWIKSKRIQQPTEEGVIDRSTEPYLRSTMYASGLGHPSVVSQWLVEETMVWVWVDGLDQLDRSTRHLVLVCCAEGSRVSEPVGKIPAGCITLDVTRLGSCLLARTGWGPGSGQMRNRGLT